MSNSSRVGKAITSYLLAASLCLSSSAAFAQAMHPPDDNNVNTQIESTPYNAVGCDQTVFKAMGNANSYLAAQSYATQYSLIRQPTTYFGCLQGILNTAQTLLNMFNGSGNVSIGTLFRTLAQAAMNQLMTYLSNQVCSMVTDAVTGIPMLGSLVGFASTGSVTGISVTSLLGVPANAVVPIDNTFRLALTQANPNTSPPSGSDLNADLNFGLQTGGLSVQAAASARPVTSVPVGGAPGSITVPNGTVIANAAPPTPNKPLSSFALGPPNPSGARSPAAAYDPATDPYNANGISPQGKSLPIVSYWFKSADGSGRICAKGGNNPWRHTNVGDLTPGTDIKNGSLGNGGRFNIYPNRAIGERAIYEWMLYENHYYGSNHSIAEAMSKFAPPSENATASYVTAIVNSINSLGGTVTKDTKIGTLNQAQMDKFVTTIMRLEGGLTGQAFSNCKAYP